MPLGETEAATCRTMKESRYLFRYFGVCAQRAEVSRFRCAYRCRYKAVEPSPRGSAAPNRRHRARMAALELATASSDSGLDATRDRTCSYSSVVRRHRCDHRPHHGQPTSVRDCIQRERSKSVRLPSNTRYVHRRVDREQTVGTHSMRGIETEMGPASTGPFPCLKSVVGRGLSTSRTLCSVSFSCLIRVTGNISMFRFHPCVVRW